MHIEGTPLRLWPALTPANIVEFEALKIYSVEGLAQIPDSSLQKVMGLREWREKARAYLAVSKDSAAAVRYAEENVRLNDEIGELNRKLVALGAQVSAPQQGRQQHGVNSPIPQQQLHGQSRQRRQ